MNEPILKKFLIRKLFNERDVSITFESNIKILVAENGHGKTTILNALYYVTTGNLLSLRKIDFESIELIFNDGEKFEIKHAELKLFEGLKHSGFYEHLKLILTTKGADDLLTDFF